MDPESFLAGTVTKPGWRGTAALSARTGDRSAVSARARAARTVVLIDLSPEDPRRACAGLFS